MREAIAPSAKQTAASGSSRRRFIGGALALGAGARLLGSPSFAQTRWPERPIRIIVPYAAGQGADVLTRLLAQEMQKTLGQPIVVENRAGAGGNIGAAAAAKSTPDGYTFLLGTNATNAANEFLYPSLGFNPGTDLEAVAMIGLLPMVISSSQPEFQTNGIAALVARAKAMPNTLNVGLPSTTAQVVFAQFVKEAGAPLFAVAYKASGQSMTDVLGGQIPLTIDTVTASRANIASGKLRALGITSLRASEMLPGVQSVAEQGITGFDVVAWDAFFAPRGTPATVAARVSDHVKRALAQDEVRRRLLDIGVEPRYMSAPELDAFVKTERRRWGDTIRMAGIKTE